MTGVLYRRRVQFPGLSLELRTENKYKGISTRLHFLWSSVLSTFSASSVSLQIIVRASVGRTKGSNRQCQLLQFEKGKIRMKKEIKRSDERMLFISLLT